MNKGETLKSKTFTNPSEEEALDVKLKTAEGRAEVIKKLVKHVKSLEYYMTELRDSIKDAFEDIVNEDKEYPEE